MRATGKTEAKSGHLVAAHRLVAALVVSVGIIAAAVVGDTASHAGYGDDVGP
ncbi:MAG: hypothetical protein ACRDMV_19215 [Streptosporangiales bacterium]